MKNNWIQCELGDVTTTQYGLSVALNSNGQGFKIFRMGEVQSGRLIDAGSMKRANISAAEFEKYALKKGDLLFNRTNSFELVGKTGIFVLEGDYCFASYLIRLTVNRSRLLPKFLNYFMNSSAFQSSVKAKASRSINQANINASILAREFVQLPALREQLTIVALLDEAFEYLATAKANAERNVLNARELLKNHVMRVIASGAETWPTKTIDQISTNLDSKRVPVTKSDRKSGDVPYYGASGIVDYVADHIFEGDALLVSEDGANLLARSSPIAFSVSGRYWVNNHAHILKFEDIATQRFVEFFLESTVLDEWITGAAQPKLNQKSLNSIPIRIPRTTTEQAEIVGKLEKVTAQVDLLEGAYEKQRVALDELKEVLLTRAFSGALTHRSLERSVAEVT